MKHRHHLSAWQVVADNFMLFFIWGMVLVALLLASFHVKATLDKDYHPKAEYIIILDWPDDRNVDLDLWLRDGYDHYVFYRNKEISNISLDRDSRGSVSNKSVGPDGKPIISGNEEIITIRALLPGVYQIAVTYYNDNAAGHADETPTHALDYNVKLIKVNPQLKILWQEKKTISLIKEVQRVVTFRINEDGTADVIPNPPDSFLGDQAL